MSDEIDDDPLEVIWDDLHLASHRIPPEVEAAEQLRRRVQPNDLVIGTSRQRILVVIKPDGQVEFGPEYRPDDAAMVFWEAMGRQRYQFEERLILIQHMEALLTRLGAADMRLEELRLRVQNGDREAGQQAGGALTHLEQLVHQTIELGRGLARRPDLPMPAMPEHIPDRIRQNPQSDYQGRTAIDDDPEPEDSN